MVNPSITTRFIILAGARTGSSVLTNTLNMHPDCYCHGHPFFQNHKHLSALRPEAEAVMDFGERDTDPVRYAKKVLEFTPGPRVVGFKIWPGNQNGGYKALTALAPDPEIKKVILIRSNHLAGLSSGGLVRMKQKYPTAFEGDGPRPQIHFNRAAFLEWTDRRTRYLQHYRKIAQENVMEIPYLGLMETGVQKISRFLELSDFDFKPRMKKRNTADILGRYRPEYHNDIKRILDDIGHPEWVTEE